MIISTICSILICGLSIFSEKEACFDKKSINEAIETAIGYYPKMYNLHIDSSRLPIKVLKNRYVRNKPDLVIFDRTALYVKKGFFKKNLKQYVEITKIDVFECQVVIEFFNHFGNSSGKFIFKKECDEIIMVESHFYEY